MTVNGNIKPRSFVKSIFYMYSSLDNIGPEHRVYVLFHKKLHLTMQYRLYEDS